MGVLRVLDWGLGFPGAFLCMLASGLATFAAVAAFDHSSSRPVEEKQGTAGHRTAQELSCYALVALGKGAVCRHTAPQTLITHHGPVKAERPRLARHKYAVAACDPVEKRILGLGLRG